MILLYATYALWLVFMVLHHLAWPFNLSRCPCTAAELASELTKRYVIVMHNNILLLTEPKWISPDSYGISLRTVVSIAQYPGHNFYLNVFLPCTFHSVVGNLPRRYARSKLFVIVFYKYYNIWVMRDFNCRRMGRSERIKLFYREKLRMMKR
jgi:hypothetical protein